MNEQQAQLLHQFMTENLLNVPVHIVTFENGKPRRFATNTILKTARLVHLEDEHQVRFWGANRQIYYATAVYDHRRLGYERISANTTLWLVIEGDDMGQGYLGITLADVDVGSQDEIERYSALFLKFDSFLNEYRRK